MLINFDLPWNPMKVEQRIGRIDRIGQRHDEVKVLNLCYVGSAEEIVYGRLMERLDSAGLVVGTQQMSLLPVTEEEFRDLAAGDLDEQELMRRALVRAAAAKARTESMEIPAEELYEIYRRLESQTGQHACPATLDDIWTTLSESEVLQRMGCRVLTNTNHAALTVCGLAGVPEQTILTISRSGYEAGIAEAQGAVHFASYGDPVFERMLDLFDECPLPKSVRRLSVSGADEVEVVAYAALVRTGPDASEVRLLTGMSDLIGLSLDESDSPDEAACDLLLAQLAGMARTELATVEAAQAIHERNEKSGQSQETLSRLVAKAILEDRRRIGIGDPMFRQELQVLEDNVLTRDQPLRVTGLPTTAMAQLEGVPFHFRIPTTGDTMHLDAPLPLLVSAVAVAARQADVIRERRADVTTERVIQRL